MRSDRGRFLCGRSIRSTARRSRRWWLAPGDPGNGVPVADAARERPKIDIAYGGSCTAGKREDFDRYHEVLVVGCGAGTCACSQDVKLYLQFGTIDVRDYCVRAATSTPSARGR